MVFALFVRAPREPVVVRAVAENWFFRVVVDSVVE